MCGLAGEVRRDGSRPDVAAVERMAATMADRGPDGAGNWSQGRVALGHRRLKIIDLSAASGQPMVDGPSGLSGVFNGCIYNYPELRAELEARGHRFFSKGDTEVILKAYAEWGDDFVDHLKGMFAVVLVERDTERVVLARDRLGIKPLYLAEDPDRVRFASTLPALLAGGGIDTSIDPVALHHYLTFHSVVPAPLTILNGVRKLPPATVRVIEPDGRRARQGLLATRLRPGRRARRLVGHRLAGRRRGVADARPCSGGMVADVPVGVLLSGGLDSSLVVALLARNGQRGLQTFSIGFESVGGREGDEFQYSDIVAREFATDHHQIRIAAADLLPAAGGRGRGDERADGQPRLRRVLPAQPGGRPALKVVQSGQGADEVFGGYHWYPPLAGVSRDAAVDTYARAFFDRDATGTAEVVLAPLPGRPAIPAGSSSAGHLAAPGAQTAVDAGLRIDTR